MKPFAHLLQLIFQNSCRTLPSNKADWTIVPYIWIKPWQVKLIYASAAIEVDSMTMVVKSTALYGTNRKQVFPVHFVRQWSLHHILLRPAKDSFITQDWNEHFEGC